MKLRKKLVFFLLLVFEALLKQKFCCCRWWTTGGALRLQEEQLFSSVRHQSSPGATVSVLSGAALCCSLLASPGSGCRRCTRTGWTAGRNTNLTDGLRKVQRSNHLSHNVVTYKVTQQSTGCKYLIFFISFVTVI